MDPSEPQADRLAQIVQREVVRRTRLTAALVLATCAVAVASAITWRERRQIQRAAAELAGCERGCSEPPPPGVPFSDPARTLASPLPIAAVLETPLEVLCPSGDLRDLELADAVAPGAVHLVNLWQMSCPSCKREFPLLGQALGRAGPVRFLPVDDADIGLPADDYRVAQARHAMPTPSLALVDRDRDGARLLPALERFAAATPLTSTGHLVYPLSFALDCERHLRWWKVGAVDVAEADALAELLTTLGREPTCRPDPPRPAVCNEPRRPKPVRKDRPRPPPPDPALATQPVVEEPAPAPAPEPAPEPASEPAPEPVHSLHQTRVQCREHCREQPGHTCQAAEQGLYRCAPPPPPL